MTDKSLTSIGIFGFYASLKNLNEFLMGKVCGRSTFKPERFPRALYARSHAPPSQRSSPQVLFPS